MLDRPAAVDGFARVAPETPVAGGVPEPSGHAVSGGTRQRLGLSLLALGVVYGDIGTSPLYALRECFNGHGLQVDLPNVLGVLSLIFWSLTLIASVKYLRYVLEADNHGEGGILALMALSLSKERRQHYRNA